ncbi:hypothetical protein IFM89_034424 [Coptis chinensis]|uniref:Pentatricopeptide repeat-containing protein n=1 Tax=Coptis chinensis TaxID=261450 RepID=A0A835IZ80_9MAGN|nr:hypothetical protein IFM89_034424 [Coptis chinensis]
MIVFQKSLFLKPNSTFPRLLCTSTIQNALSQQIPISETFVSHLETCSSLISLKKLHACIITLGLETHIFLGSKLLNTYAKFNSLTESRHVFSKIINRNLSLWNSTLVGYFRTGYFNEVLRLYLKLKKENIGIDSSTLTFCLKSCVELGVVEFGRGVHVDCFKFGLNADRFVGSSLIGFYSKYGGGVEVARKVFDEISDKDVIAYTAMVTGYAQLGSSQAYEAFRIVGCMRENGFDPNRVTLVSLLQVAARLEAVEEGRMIHGYAIRRDIGCLDEVFNTCLVDMYVKCGVPDAAECIFSRMNTKSVVCWNALIAGHVQVGQPLRGLELFGCMMQENIMPDVITLSNGLLACAELEFLLQGKGIHAYILRAGIQLDLVAVTALIDMYSKCRYCIKYAKELFYGMEARDTILFNVMIAGYLGCKSPGKALETFYGMVEAGFRPNIATILSILTASAQLTDIREGRRMHGYVVTNGLESNTDIANQILYMYTKCGCLDLARLVFNRILSRDLVSWTSMMMGYVHHGQGDETVELFRLMLEARMDPDSVTLISLLQAFSQLGCLKSAKAIQGYIYRVHFEKEIPVINSLATTYAKCGRLDMAELLFEHTGRRGLTSWNTMIAAYGMHGNCIEALELFKRMQHEKVKPDELTFTSLISACSHAGLVEEGQKVFQSMTAEHSIVPQEEHYGCMADLLARAGRFEEAYHIVKCLPPKQSSSALAALLAACRVYENMDMGEIVAKQLLDLEPDNSGAYTLLSNIYAEAEKWEEVARLRETVTSRGVRRQPGYSMIDLDKQVIQW